MWRYPAWLITSDHMRSVLGVTGLGRIPMCSKKERSRKLFVPVDHQREESSVPTASRCHRKHQTCHQLSPTLCSPISWRNFQDLSNMLKVSFRIFASNTVSGISSHPYITLSVGSDNLQLWCQLQTWERPNRDFFSQFTLGQRTREFLLFVIFSIYLRKANSRILFTIFTIYLRTANSGRTTFLEKKT